MELLSVIVSVWWCASEALAVADSTANYSPSYGTYIGKIKAYSEGISGQVYIVDDRHLFLHHFVFTRSSPVVHFWVGDDTQPSPKGQIVPYPPLPQYNAGQTASDEASNEHVARFNQINKEPPGLQPMHDEDVLLALPAGLRVTDIRWLSLWNRRFTSNYGEIFIPSNATVPAPVTVGRFPNEGKKLSSGLISVIDTESFSVPSFFLRIHEPGYHFVVGASDAGPNNQGTAIANEKDRFDDLRAYDGQDVILTLPKSLTMFDINYLSVYNSAVQHSIGHVSFNVSGLAIPPALGQTKKPGWWFNMPINRLPAEEKDSSRDEVSFNHTVEPGNCRELLGRRMRLLWINEGGHIYFRLKVHMEPTQFAAVGIVARGSPNIEADLVKVFFNESANRYVTEDTFLAKQLLCDFSYGLCPDTSHQGSNDDVRYLGSVKQHGLAVIDFRRSILPADMHDAPISLDGPTQVLVAIGSLHSERRPFSLNTNLNMEIENTTIDFSSSQVEDTCPDITKRKMPEPDPDGAWEPSVIRGLNLLVAQLGPTGGQKGYGAITGGPPIDKSVVWWVNKKLMPEIYVERGKTYYFRVQGGDSVGSKTSYHPLYITTHPEGGFGRKLHMERKLENILAGVENFGGQETPTGVGPLCEFTSEGADKAVESKTFQEYYSTLKLACEPGRTTEYGWVNWTVRHDTPDVVYYQSFADFGLGWKIHVINEGETTSAAAVSSASAVALLAAGAALCACIGSW